MSPRGPDDSALENPVAAGTIGPVSDASIASDPIKLAPPTATGWTWRQLLTAAAVLACLAAAAFAIDLHAVRWIDSGRLPGDLRRLLRLAEVFGWGGTVILIIATAATLDRRGWRVIPRLAIGSLGAGLLADCLKVIGIERMRPAAALERGLDHTFGPWLPLLSHDSTLGAYGHRFQSFPSGHSATAAGLAIALAALYPRGRWLFVLFAALACIQRIDALAHFPSDILAGAAVGCLVGALLARTHRSPT
jgi:membrane-associated phospholipid phosphatase